MGKTSSAVKNKYNAKAYDQIPLRVKKGEREIIRAFAEKRGESLNGFISRIIKQEMEREAENPVPEQTSEEQ